MPINCALIGGGGFYYLYCKKYNLFFIKFKKLMGTVKAKEIINYSLIDNKYIFSR